MVEYLKKHRVDVVIIIIIIGLTISNYYLNGGPKSNWNEFSTYGFTMLYPPGLEPYIIGLDEEYVFDLNAGIPASMDAGMIGFGVDNKEYALTWAKIEPTPSIVDVLDIYYHSVEVNSVRRDRGFDIQRDPAISVILNGHEALYQTHFLLLDMPGMVENLYARGLVEGWTCSETGISYVFYVLVWNTGSAPLVGDSVLHGYMDKYIEFIECH